MTILELREKRNTAWNAAKAFLDSHRTEKGTLTAEDDATYSRMEQEIADLGKEIARLERQEALEAELNKPVNKPLTSKPGNSATDKPVKTGRASDEYKNDMLQALRTNFRQVSNILQEGVDADGGYLVPEEYDSRLIDVLTEEISCEVLATPSQLPVSIRSTSLLRSLQLHGLRKAAHFSFLMRPSVRSFWMRTNSM